MVVIITDAVPILDDRMRCNDEPSLGAQRGNQAVAEEELAKETETWSTDQIVLFIQDKEIPRPGATWSSQENSNRFSPPPQSTLLWGDQDVWL